MDLPLLKNLTESDLRGKRVLVRLDLNVPVEHGVLMDDYRIRRAYPTIKFLHEKGARLILMSHHTDAKQTLEPTVRCLEACVPVSFVKNTLDTEAVTKALEERSDAVVLLENLRMQGEEESNDAQFAKTLAGMGELYVNDAFSASHRNHASIVSLPQLLPSYAGLLLEEEIEKLSIAFDPPHPFLFILGGGKVSSKFHLIQKFITIADRLFIGGALATNFYKAEGYEIGKSLYEDMGSALAPLLGNERIIVPVDVRVSNSQGSMLKKPSSVDSEDKILDVGPATLELLNNEIKKAKFILWNGPLGDYTIPGFDVGSLALVSFLAGSEAQVVARGGDTVTLISQKGMHDQFGFVSTGGGAMLEFLANGTLPGIEALKTSK